MKPNIIAIAAVTIDGKIARHAEHFTDWTSPEDKAFMRAFLDNVDVVVVGNTTYRTAEGPLSKRNCIVFTRSVEGEQCRRDRLMYYNPVVGCPIEMLLAPYRTVALLGGAQIYSYFLQLNLIDELYLTIEPVVFGEGLSLFEGRGNITANFQLLAVRTLNEKGSVLLHYRRPS